MAWSRFALVQTRFMPIFHSSNDMKITFVNRLVMTLSFTWVSMALQKFWLET